MRHILDPLENLLQISCPIFARTVGSHILTGLEDEIMFMMKSKTVDNIINQMANKTLNLKGSTKKHRSNLIEYGGIRHRSNYVQSKRRKKHRHNFDGDGRSHRPSQRFAFRAESSGYSSVDSAHSDCQNQLTSGESSDRRNLRWRSSAPFSRRQNLQNFVAQENSTDLLKTSSLKREFMPASYIRYVSAHELQQQQQEDASQAFHPISVSRK